MQLKQVTHKVKRSKQEMILMLLSGAAAVGLIPFIVLRVLYADWPNAILDICLFIIFVINGLYVYRTGKVRIPRLVFALLLLLAMFVGFYIKGIGQIPWSYPGLVAIFFAVRPNLAAILCSICIAWLATVLYPLLDIFEYVTFLATLTSTCLFVYVFANLTRQQRKALIKLSRRDPLTNLRNRRAFDLALNQFIGFIRDQQHTCMLLIDIDHFKDINDKFGHSVGDDVLRALGKLMTKRMRKSDLVYRIGGEEFAIILTNSSVQSAINVAKDMGCLVEEADIVDDRKITISIGIADYCENESKDSWFKRCDDALYLAKDSGRNNFKLADSLSSTLSE